jgi:hypothetical protein
VSLNKLMSRNYLRATAVHNTKNGNEKNDDIIKCLLSRNELTGLLLFLKTGFTNHIRSNR